MASAIICDARQGESLGINHLALVDRTKTKRLWWTSDDSSIIMNFRTKELAESVLNKLEHGDPQIVSYGWAVGIIEEQYDQIIQDLCCEPVWDTHW